jgi:apolipoprotein N-acyltransferase
VGPVLPWSYLAGLMPIPVVAGIAFAMAVPWAAAVAFSRAAQRRGPAWATPFALGIALASFDTLLSAASPDGTAASLAYTQSELLPLAQLASLGGTSWVVFVMGVVASTLALSIDRASHAPVGARGLGLALGVIAAAWTFGAWRLAPPPAEGGMPVAAIAIDAPIADRRRDRAAFDRLPAAYEGAVAQAAAARAALVLLPERIGDIAAADVDAVSQRLSAMARAHRVDLVVGVGVFDATKAHNEAWWFDAAQGTLARYRKQHLVQGLEARFTPGPAEGVSRTLAGRTLALAICKDMDFPDTIRRSAAADVSALVVPAWDFGTDGWLHSRMAVWRGVENGVPVLRAARDGRLTISDAFGRVHHEAQSANTPVLLQGRLPPRLAPTLFARGGHLAAWLWPLVLALWLASLRRSRA